MVSNAGTLEFASLHSETLDSLESYAGGGGGGLPSGLQQLESRGQRVTDSAPGRTYECESVCREALRLVAGVLGVAMLTFAYATFGGFLFMTVENR